MTEENSQVNVEDSQDQATNVAESNPDSVYKQDMMKYKTQRNELRDELESYKAKEEKARVKKLEEEGKLKELLAERDSTIEKLKAQTDSQDSIVNNYKNNLINNLTSDEERKANLLTKSVDFLEELTKEKDALAPKAVDNPKESLGAVRNVLNNKSYTDMTEAERRAWHEKTFKGV